jgi:hypothetical protein
MFTVALVYLISAVFELGTFIPYHDNGL